ncbi:MAG: hypothetical protein JWM96_125 [Alphaproteobacteria bacterium]|nr:hypothetical protein [Alphaproteobacteria bacterium]
MKLLVLILVIMCLPEVCLASSVPIVQKLKMQNINAEILKLIPEIQKDIEEDKENHKSLQDIQPLEIYMQKIPFTEGKTLLFVTYTGSLWCGIQNCPLTIYEIEGKVKTLAKILEVVAPPVEIYTISCPNDFSILLSSHLDRFSKWSYKKAGFKYIAEYPDLSSASKCN